MENKELEQTEQDKAQEQNAQEQSAQQHGHSKNGDELTPSQQRRRERARRRRRARMIRRLVTAGAILLTVVAIGLGIFFTVRQKNKENAYSEYDAQIDKLAYRKQQLLSELDRLGPDMEKQLGNTSYMSFIFTSLDEGLYTSAHPIMAEGSTDLVGILALSPNELPDMEGKITKKQFDTLMLLEWGTALYWDGVGDLQEFIITMQSLLDERQIDFPETIIFKNGKYRAEYDQIILSYGIENAIHNGETGLAIRIAGQPEGVWHPGVVGWKAGMSATLLKRSVESEGGYALLEINFNNSPDNSAYSYFEIEGEGTNVRIDSFRKMINLFKTSVQSKNIEILTTEEVRAKVEKYYSELSVIEIEHAQRRKEINDEIAEIDRQMAELYYEYYGG